MGSLRKKRRIAGRALKVLGRHRALPSIGAHSGTLTPAATAYVDAYDDATRYKATWKREMEEGRGSLAALLAEINRWKPLVRQHNPSMDLSLIGDKPDVPEDLLEDAAILADAVDAIRGPDGTVPDWTAGARAVLLAKIATADRETDEAAAADDRWTRLQRAVQEAGAKLDAVLPNFRESVRMELKRSHRDFQKLRADRASEPDEDDETPPTPPA